MDIRKRKVKGIYVLSVLIILCLCLASILSLFVSQKSANALTDTSLATNIGDGKEMWLDEIGKFDKDVFEDLTDKLFGNQDWTTYIKTMKDTQTDSYVIPASTINANAGNADNGLVVKLGNLEWMVASLTLTNDGREDVVVTLYLSDEIGTSQYYSSRSNVKGYNMYSSSILRNTLLTSDTFQLFSDGAANGFASKYLMPPKNIKYHTNQTIVGRGAPYNYNHPNDALGALSSGWYSVNYQPADTFDGVRYDEWGNDYIWIPSGVETGWNNYLSTTSIWQLSASQRTHSTKFSWLRTGVFNDYGYAQTINSNCIMEADYNY
ncbi:MAG: hypothetical protein K2N32_02810, partial [Clostridia bacterium]|nr:hypothetical protein [Clostridia bacterium]